MATSRKLQMEIERCLKKVAECVDLFDVTWRRMNDTTKNASDTQKRKDHEDLKKEVRKMRRLRDQIRTWIGLDDVKNKSQLVEAKRAIEKQMERLEESTRTLKTKSFSVFGLNQASQSLAERNRDEIVDWLVASIDSLSMQLDQFQCEIESVQPTKRKPSRATSQRLAKLRARETSHQFHIGKLEAVLRLFNNLSISVNQVQLIREDVNHYIESSQEVGFEDNVFIYDDITGFDDSLTSADITVANIPAADISSGISAADTCTPADVSADINTDTFSADTSPSAPLPSKKSGNSCSSSLLARAPHGYAHAVQEGANEVQGGASEVQGGANKVQRGANEVQGGANVLQKKSEHACCDRRDKTAEASPSKPHINPTSQPRSLEAKKQTRMHADAGRQGGHSADKLPDLDTSADQVISREVHTEMHETGLNYTKQEGSEADSKKKNHVWTFRKQNDSEDCDVKYAACDVKQPDCWEFVGKRNGSGTCNTKQDMNCLYIGEQGGNISCDSKHDAHSTKHGVHEDGSERHRKEAGECDAATTYILKPEPYKHNTTPAVPHSARKSELHIPQSAFTRARRNAGVAAAPSTSLASASQSDHCATNWSLTINEAAFPRLSASSTASTVYTNKTKSWSAALAHNISSTGSRHLDQRAQSLNQKEGNAKVVMNTPSEAAGKTKEKLWSEVLFSNATGNEIKPFSTRKDNSPELRESHVDAVSCRNLHQLSPVLSLDDSIYTHKIHDTPQANPRVFHFDSSKQSSDYSHSHHRWSSHKEYSHEQSSHGECSPYEQCLRRLLPDYFAPPTGSSVGCEPLVSLYHDLPPVDLTCFHKNPTPHFLQPLCARVSMLLVTTPSPVSHKAVLQQADAGRETLKPFKHMAANAPHIVTSKEVPKASSNNTSSAAADTYTNTDALMHLKNGLSTTPCTDVNKEVALSSANLAPMINQDCAGKGLPESLITAPPAKQHSTVDIEKPNSFVTKLPNMQNDNSSKEAPQTLTERVYVDCSGFQCMPSQSASSSSPLDQLTSPLAGDGAAFDVTKLWPCCYGAEEPPSATSVRHQLQRLYAGYKRLAAADDCVSWTKPQPLYADMQAAYAGHW